MTKIIVGDLHTKLLKASIPIITVRLTKDGAVELEFEPEATDQHKADAALIVKQYDQAAEDALKVAPLTADEITSLKALLVKPKALKG